MNAVELTMMEVRASGPVSQNEIAEWLREQLIGCNTDTAAQLAAERSIAHGLRTGWLAVYDKDEPVHSYVMA